LTDRLRIVVAVYMVRGPMGALSWHYLQYALGLAQLGHHVTVVEDSDDHEWTCWDPSTGTLGIDPTYGLEFTAEIFDRVGMSDCWVYYDAHQPGWVGPAARDITARLLDADLFINISGANLVRPWTERIPRRVFIDTDPGFVQVRHLTDPVRRAAAEQHNRFLTFGERFGQPDCQVPDDGFAWRPTRQPVCLDAWPVRPPVPDGPFTTVMRWDSYRPATFGDLRLGMKSESFASYFSLPSRTTARLQMALGAPFPGEELEDAGWQLCDPQQIAPLPWDFQDYVARSAGEFTVAKHGYVATRSGWFSERSAGYLASGRPVITQETGFSSVLPTGSGLIAFDDPETALAALEDVTAQPRRHADAARDIAVEHFDSRRVLQKLLDDVS